MTDLLILIHSLDGGGAERTAVNIANGLSRGGFKVCIATQSAAVEDRYAVDANVTRRTLGLESDSANAFMGLINNVNRVRKTRQVIQEYSPRCVLALMPSQNVIAVLANLFRSSRLVISERNYPGMHDGRLWYSLRNLVYRFADCVVVQTGPVKTWIQEKTGSKRIEIVPNFVTGSLEGTAQSGEVAQFADDRFDVVLAVGRGVDAKGFDLLIEAYSKLSLKRLTKLVIVGVDNSDAYQAQIERLGLQDSVVFPGRIGNVYEWYDRSSIFVLSSRREGFPNVLLEAMSRGCAVVAFDCLSGPADLIEHKVNGLLVPPEDTDVLAEAMDTLLVNDKLNQSVREKAKLVQLKYSEEKILNQWNTIFQLDKQV